MARKKNARRIIHVNSGSCTRIPSKARNRRGKKSARSDYRKSLPGDFIRFRLKIEQNCRLFLDIFCCAILNDLFMTFTSRLKVDAKCVYQQWTLITVANYFGTPPADWVHGYLSFEPGAWIWKKGVPTLFAYSENLIWKFFFKFKQGTCPWMAFA